MELRIIPFLLLFVWFLETPRVRSAVAVQRRRAPALCAEGVTTWRWCCRQGWGEGSARGSRSGTGATEPGVGVRMRGPPGSGAEGWGAGSPGVAWRKRVWGGTGTATLHCTAVICSAWFPGSRCGTCTGWCRLRGSRAGRSAPSPRTPGPGAVLRTLGVLRSLPAGDKRRQLWADAGTCGTERPGGGDAEDPGPSPCAGSADIGPGCGYLLPSSLAPAGSRRAPLSPQYHSPGDRVRSPGVYIQP